MNAIASIEPVLSLPTAFILLAVGVTTQALFAGTEIALMGADRLVLRARAEEGDSAARRVLQLLERPSRLVSTCLVGVALGSVFAATVFTDIAGHFTSNPTLAAAIAFPPIAIIFAELIPKALFHQYATALAPRLIVPLLAMSTVLRPLLWATEVITRGLSRAFGVICIPSTSREVSSWIGLIFIATLRLLSVISGRVHASFALTRPGYGIGS